MGEPMHKVLAPVSGTYVPIEDVADPVFAQKMMGDGFAVTPTLSWRRFPARSRPGTQRATHTACAPMTVLS